MNPDQLRQLAQAIAREMNPGGGAASSTPSAPVGGTAGHGVFETVDEAVRAARGAFVALDGVTLDVRSRIIDAIRIELRAQAEPLARFAYEETGLGRFEDKIAKNLLVTNMTPGTEVLVPYAKSGDRGLTIEEPAPFGVIGAITPTTNPTSTIICNAIGMLAAGNTVVFNVHPNAKEVSKETVRILNRVIVGAGGPPNCVTCVGEPTIESAGALMGHPLVRLLVVTGGGGVVKAAMNSGKRAICAGPGNPPAVVDETANIAAAARDLVAGHSFDNNVICVDEKEVIAVDSITDGLKAAMCANGAVELPRSDLQRLERVIFKEMAGPKGHATINRDLIGKNASVILGELGIAAGPEAKTVLIEVPNEHPLIWTEQMMPVLPITRVANVDMAIELAIEAEGGCFHTASMHSTNIAALSKMARMCNCSIFVKNGPNYAGLSQGGEGYTSFTIASPTGEGLTGPREFSRWRRCTLVDHFRIV